MSTKTNIELNTEVYNLKQQLFFAELNIEMLKGDVEAYQSDEVTDAELLEIKASAAEAHLHIEHLHKLIKQYNLTRKITEVVKAWEDSQC